MDFKMHEFTHALVGKVTPALRLTDKADLNDARRQYDCYLRLLKELNVEVLELEMGSLFPDNIFLEDTAIVCHGIALLPRATSSLELIKMKAVKEILSKDLGQTIIEVDDPEAKIFGSDVLFTGREFFVGICETSNEAGASAVAEAFPEFPCTPIKISKGSDHLKKYITVAGPDILCVGASKEAKEILKRMEREASFSYQTLTVPEDDAANCLYVNGTLIHRAIEEIPDSFKACLTDTTNKMYLLKVADTQCLCYRMNKWRSNRFLQVTLQETPIRTVCFVRKLISPEDQSVSLNWLKSPLD